MNKIVILKPFCRYLLSPLWGYLWTVDGKIQEQKYILLSWHYPRRLWDTFANTQMIWFLILLIVMKGFLFIMTNGIFYTFLICISVEDLLILSLQTHFFILGFELSNARKFLTSCLLSPFSIEKETLSPPVYQLEQPRMVLMASWQLFTFQKSCNICWKTLSIK